MKGKKFSTTIIIVEKRGAIFVTEIGTCQRSEYHLL